MAKPKFIDTKAELPPQSLEIGGQEKSKQQLELSMASKQEQKEETTRPPRTPSRSPSRAPPASFPIMCVTKKELVEAPWAKKERSSEATPVALATELLK